VLVYRARFGDGTALAAKTDQRVLRKEVDAAPAVPAPSGSR
jgi:hypothetical protein